MKVTEQDLRERYENLETHQLIELQTQGRLTETATRVLEQVLAERSVSVEERAAVTSEVQKRVAERDAMEAALASLAARVLGIAVIDRRTHRPCSYGESFVRNILLWLLGIIDWIFIFGRTRQRLGDMAASTIVVRVNHPGLAALKW